MIFDEVLVHRFWIGKVKNIYLYIYQQLHVFRVTVFTGYSIKYVKYLLSTKQTEKIDLSFLI